MEVVSLQTKFKLLFDKFTEPNYVLNSYYAENLLINLSSDDAEIVNLLDSKYFIDFVVKGLENLDDATISVQVFLLRLIAKIAKEPQFTMLLKCCGGQLLKGMTNIVDPKVPPSIKVAYIVTATAFASHSSGVAWLLETELWKIILNLRNEKQTIFVLKEVCKFASKLLWQLNDQEDESNLITILQHVLDPITSNPYYNLKTISKEEEMALTTRMEPCFHILVMILTPTERLRRPHILTTLLTKHFTLEYHLYVILKITHREDLMLLLCKVTMLLVFTKAFGIKLGDNEEFPQTSHLNLGVACINISQLLVRRGLFLHLFDFCCLCCVMWSELWSNAKAPTVERNGKILQFQDQLIILLLVPAFVLVKKREKCCDTKKLSIESYIINLFNTSCEHTTRTAYMIRSALEENKNPLYFVQQCIKRLFSLKNHIGDPQANMIFQALFYILINYVPVDDTGVPIVAELNDFHSDKLLLLTHVVDAIAMLLKGHNITWQSSLEILCLYNEVDNILKMKNLPCKVVVKAMSLLTLTVKLFLPPNLTLLMESQSGSSLHDIGKIIYLKMHDQNWEVRDSALELLLECTEISFIKYTPFQKLILESNCISVAATIAFSDAEMYVQASALKCLGAASKVQDIWVDLLQNHPNLHMQIVNTLENNPEGIVRKEAVCVLCEIYLRKNLEPGFMNVLYQHMALAAVNDFHWEVQLAALRFWKEVINVKLADQGMLDGTFPPVTFSKEHRKIVTLNEKEVQRRIVKLLNELADIGCLRVLFNLLHEDTDIEIMEYTLTVSKILLDIILQYRVKDIIDKVVVTSENKDRPSCSDMDISADNLDLVNYEGTSKMNSDSNNKSDIVIEEILNLKDINLLANIYESELKSKLETSTAETPKVASKDCQKNVTLSAFLNMLCSTDYQSLIEEKKKWRDGIKSLPSLLDDILGLYETSEVNDLDCY